MNIAPVEIIWACFRIIGIARLPTADAPVKNLAASIHLERAKETNKYKAEIINKYIKINKNKRS